MKCRIDVRRRPNFTMQDTPTTGCTPKSSSSDVVRVRNVLGEGHTLVLLRGCAVREQRRVDLAALDGQRGGGQSMVLSGMQ